MSKGIFIATLIVGAIRDLAGSVSNIDVSIAVIAGMCVAVAYHIIFEGTKEKS